MGSNVHSDDAMLQFMPPWNYNRPPNPPPEMCTVWPQLMLTAPSRKTGSHRIKRENESRFWPDNVLMIFLFFFFFLWGRKQNTFSRLKCVWQFHGALHNMYSDYTGGGIVCRRTVPFLFRIVLFFANPLMFSKKSQLFFVPSPPTTTPPPKKKMAQWIPVSWWH